MENFVNSLPLKLEELKSNARSNSGPVIVMGNEACDLVYEIHKPFVGKFEALKFYFPIHSY